MAMQPAALRDALREGLLCFPATNFAADGAVDIPAFRGFVRHLLERPVAGLFAAGGTGEFFSLTQAEHREVVAAAAAEAAGRVPVIAGIGYGTAMAVEFARAAEAAGADGLLVLPHYLLQVEPEGLYRHYAAICEAVSIGVIPYNRDNAVIPPSVVVRLAREYPNMIGFKDGIGNIEQLMNLRDQLGDSVALIGGMPTAEVYALAYRGLGFRTYSSAVYNFLPATALRFYDAFLAGDDATVERLMRDLYLPLIALRNRGRGYAVSIVKAGLRVTGRSAGPVRTPLTDLTPEEEAEVRAIIDRALPEGDR